MLKEALAVIDRLIKLKEYREIRTASRFEEIYKPTFDDLLAVHRDYVSLFNGTLNILEGGGGGDRVVLSMHVGDEESLRSDGKVTLKALKYLKERREEFEPHRVKLRALSDQLMTLDLDEPDIKFVSAFRDYFAPFEVSDGSYDNGLAIPITAASVSETAMVELEFLSELFQSPKESDIHLVEYLNSHGIDTAYDGMFFCRGLWKEMGRFRRKVYKSVDLLRQRWAVVCETYVNLQLESNRNI